jgi:RNA-directed DNA polymerase
MTPVRFDSLRTPEHVSLTWGVAVDDLHTIERAPDLSAYYKEMRIPKRGKRNRGKFRVVFKPEWGVLHQLQKNIARDIAQAVTFPDCVQGFVQGRSAISNAALHVGQRAILHVDIENFFDAIPVDRVVAALVSLGCDAAIAGLLAKICTLKGRLPQGASTSPILSNLVCTALDADLSRLAATQSARYSRYADDLAFSGDQPIAVEAVRRVLAAHGFKVREDKVRTQWRGKSQFVTGLSVADPAGPRVPRRMKRHLRLELHFAKKFGVAGHEERVGNGWSPGRQLQYWRGWIDYLGSVPSERSFASRLSKTLAAVYEAESSPDDDEESPDDYDYGGPEF